MSVPFFLTNGSIFLTGKKKVSLALVRILVENREDYEMGTGRKDTGTQE